jgi:transposase
MSQKPSAPAARESAVAPATKPPAERVMRDIRRRTRKHHSAEGKIRVVLEGLRGEDSIAALCRREGIAESLYYSWSKRSSSRPASAAWPATRRAPRPPTRSRRCARRPAP